VSETRQGGITDFGKVQEVVEQMLQRDDADRVDRTRTVSGVIIRILSRDSDGSWIFKVKCCPATFTITEKEYADACFLRERDLVVVEYLSDGQPGRPAPGQKIKVTKLSCNVLDGGESSAC